MTKAREVYNKIVSDISALNAEKPPLTGRRDALKILSLKAQAEFRAAAGGVVDILAEDGRHAFLSERSRSRQDVENALTLQKSERNFLRNRRFEEQANLDIARQARTEAKAVLAMEFQVRNSDLDDEILDSAISHQAAKVRLSTAEAAHLRALWDFNGSPLRRLLNANHAGKPGYEPGVHRVSDFIGRMIAPLKNRARYQAFYIRLSSCNELYISAQDSETAAGLVHRSALARRPELKLEETSKSYTLDQPVVAAERAILETQADIEQAKENIGALEAQLLRFERWEDNSFQAVAETLVDMISSAVITASSDLTDERLQGVATSHARMVAASKDLADVSDQLKSLTEAIDKSERTRQKMRSKGWSNSSQTVKSKDIDNYVNSTIAFDVFDFNIVSDMTSVITDMTTMFDSTPMIDCSSTMDTSSFCSPSSDF